MENPKIIAKRPLMYEIKKGEKYAWCACGLSKKEGGAFCDGSHVGSNFTPHIFIAEETKNAAICMCKNTKNPPFCDGSHANL